MYDLDNTSLGLWVDLPRRMVLTSDFFRWFAGTLKFDLMSIMIDDADPAVEFSWSAKDIERVLKLADPYAIEIALTTWPYPDTSLLRQMEKKMGDLLGVGPIAEWETDEEFNWQEDDVSGFADLDKAGDALVDIKQRLCSQYEVRNTITTFTYHRENSSKADTAQHMDRMMVQAYAVDERDGKEVTWDHRFGPGRMQTLTLNRTMKVPGVADGKPELGVGHAAWSQDGFRRRMDDRLVIMPANAAMRTSFEASLCYQPVAHNWWSAKFCYPGSRRYLPYAETFLKGLRADD